MKTALVTGASRGIGLEFVKQYRADGWRVIATARDPAALAALAGLGAETIRLDVADAASVAELGWKLDGETLDVAVHNAGVNSERTPGLAIIDAAEFDRVMHTNVLGAMHVAPLVLPLVEAAGGSFGFLSSRMGSLSLMDTPRSWLYRASKAALNVVVRAVALEARRATCVALHPGVVRTDMGGANADIAVETSVTGLRKLLDVPARERNGRFYNYDGAELSW